MASTASGMLPNPGEEHDLHARAQRPRAFQHVEPVEVRQPEVGQHEFVRPGSRASRGRSLPVGARSTSCPIRAMIFPTETRRASSSSITRTRALMTTLRRRLVRARTPTRARAGGRSGRGRRKQDREERATVRAVAQLDVTAEVARDVRGQGQTQPRSRRLAREERLENRAPVFERHTGPGIADGQGTRPSFSTDVLISESTSVRHGLQRVPHEVQRRLLELLRDRTSHTDSRATSP